MQIIDEQEQHFVRQIFAASNQILEPIVNVQRIEGGILGQITLRYVTDNGDLLAYDAEQLQIVGGTRRGGCESNHSMHFAVFHPFRDVRINLGDETAFARSVVAVNEERTVSGARPITEEYAGLYPVGQLGGYDAGALCVLVEQPQMGCVFVKDFL